MKTIVIRHGFASIEDAKALADQLAADGVDESTITYCVDEYSDSYLVEVDITSAPDVKLILDTMEEF